MESKKFWEAESYYSLADDPYFSVSVILEGGIGDLVMLSSPLRALKEMRPEFKTKLITSSTGFQVLGGAPFIDEMILYKKYKPMDCEMIINLAREMKPWEMGGFLDLESYANESRIDILHRLFSVNMAEKRTWISVDNNKRKGWTKLLPKSKPVVAIHGSASAWARSIPSRIISDLVRMLAENFTVIIVGTTHPWHRGSDIDLRQLLGTNIINLIDQTDLSDLIAVISIVDFVIAPDSGILQIAGSLGIKGIGIFGNIRPITACKYYSTIRTTYPEGTIDCIPCNDLWHCRLDFKAGPPCMNIFSAKEIYRTAMEWWNGGEKIDIRGYSSPCHQLQ